MKGIVLSAGWKKVDSMRIKNVGIGVIAALMLLAGGLTAFAPPSSSAGTPPDSTKVTICHRTNSDTNPYVVITPDVSGVLNGHAGHTGPVWNPTLKAAKTKWGDIIPAFYHDGGQLFAGQNLAALGGADLDILGQAILDNSCRIPGAPPPPEPGSLTVTKVVVGAPGTPIDHFTVVVDCGDDNATTVTLPANGGAGTPVITDIPAGSTCTVNETTALPEGTVVTYDPTDASGGVDIVTGSNTVTVTNSFPTPQVAGRQVEAKAATPVAARPAFTG